MRKYQKRLISICVSTAVCAMTALVPAAASQDAIVSGEELLYSEEENGEEIRGVEIETGGLVNPGISPTDPTTPAPTEPTTPVPTTPAPTEPTTPPPTTPAPTEPTTPPPTTPAPTEPTTPVPTTPAPTEPTTPVPTTPAPTEPTTPAPTTPSQTEPTTPAQTEPTTPAPTTPVQTEPTTPPPTTPAQTEPTTPTPTTPAPTEPTTPVPTTPSQTEPTTPAPTTPAIETTTEEETTEETIVAKLFSGKSLEIEREIKESEIPEDFNITTYSYKGTEIEIAESKNGLILFYLRDDGETAHFYIYNEGKDSCIPYVKIRSSSNEYVFLDLEEDAKELEDFDATKISVNGKTLPAWKPMEGETPKEDYIVYLMDQDSQKGLYHVNITTGVIEPYDGQSLDPADAEKEDGSDETVGDSVLQEDTSDRDEMLHKIAIFGGGAVGIIVLIIAGILLYRYLKKKLEDQEEDEQYYEDEEEDDLVDPDEEIEKELAALEQEEWNKDSFEEEDLSFEQSKDNLDSAQELDSNNIDVELLNETFNDMAAQKEESIHSEVEPQPMESLEEVDSKKVNSKIESFQDETAQELRRNLEQMLDDDDDFDVTDFTE